MDYRKTHERGFTLIEILISITILALLSVAGTASYIGVQRRVLLDSVTQEMVTYLRFAQQKALSQEGGQQWGMHFENPSSGTPFYALFSGDPYNVGNIREKLFLPSQLKYLTPASGQMVDVIFAKLTGASPGTQTIEITFKSESTGTSFKRVLIVNSLGVISIQ